MKQQVKVLLIDYLRNLQVPKNYSGFTLIEELFQLYQLHNSDKRPVLQPGQYPPSLEVSEEVLTWAGITKEDLAKLGLQISYYENVLDGPIAVLTKLTLTEWLERIL